MKSLITRDSRVRNAFWLVLFLLALLAIVFGFVNMASADPLKTKVGGTHIATEASVAKLAQDHYGNTQFVLLVQKDLASNLPACYGPSCRGRLQDVRVQQINPVWAVADAWLWVNGNRYHAHVWRINVHTDWYLWAWQGHPIWYRAIAYMAANLADPTNVKGPAVWKAVDLLAPVQCRAVANGSMVNVTSDAGTLVQPNPVTYCNSPQAPSDAGPAPDSCWTEVRRWPDGGAVITCGGSGYWLARNRFGGNEPQTAAPDAGIPAPVDAGVMPPGQLGGWVAPDAATIHSCFNVPIGTPCP